MSKYVVGEKKEVFFGTKGRELGKDLVELVFQKVLSFLLLCIQTDVYNEICKEERLK